MAENETTGTPADTGSAGTQDANATKTPEQTALENTRLVVTHAMSTKTTQHRFHTPTLLAAVKEAPEGSRVTIEVKDPGKDEYRKLAEDDRDKVAELLAQSVVPPESIPGELRKFAQFLLDHSNLKAIGCHAICLDKDGNDAGFGFVTTAPDCTKGQAVSFVNCGDANIDEFASKAHLEIPGRKGAGEGTIVAPTQDQIEKLG